MREKAIKHCGVISRRMRWGLTLWGWMFILLVLFLCIYCLLTRVYPILAPNRPVNADMLVLEGSVPDYVLDSAIAEFRNGNYRLLITTGTPLEWGHLLVQFGNTAAIAASSLERMGFDTACLAVVATKEIQNDRTYNSALELAFYLKKHYPGVREINLMSYGPHGRRSQMMFQAALGDSVRVGIISVRSFYYGATDWWRSSKGFREVMNEFLGYIYARFFFVPYSFREDKQR